jgi:hypothetical protein
MLRRISDDVVRLSLRQRSSEEISRENESTSTTLVCENGNAHFS